MTAVRRWVWLTGLAVVFVALALLHPVDHDESQYVAAAVLTAHGLMPYRDFAYLQTPLQPFVLAPIAAVASTWTWLALRIANAMLGVVAVGFVAGAARRAGATQRMAMAAAGLFASCDILLFSIGTARNDALPAALLACALYVALGKRSRRAALLTGLLLASAAAAKISYALPAAAYGLWTLIDRERRAGWTALGAIPVVAFIAWTYALSPVGFLFGTLQFPAHGPAEYYADRPWKLSWTVKAIDLLKFLALGPALLALAATVRDRTRRSEGLLSLMIGAGLLAALLPSPTWRQYLLPMLPPLFIRLAMVWSARSPSRGWRIATAVFVVAGLAPSIAQLAGTDGQLSLAQAMRYSTAIRTAMDRAGVTGPVVTLSPEFLPATGRLPDPAFATGPFYFRSHALLGPAEEAVINVVSAARLTHRRPAAFLIGGESPSTGGNAALDAQVARWALREGYRATPIPGTAFRLVTPPAASPPSTRHNSR